MSKYKYKLEEVVFKDNKINKDNHFIEMETGYKNYALALDEFKEAIGGMFKNFIITETNLKSKTQKQYLFVNQTLEWVSL